MKKFLKKFFKWLGILLLLILALLITLPIIFEDDIAQAIKDTANEELNATFDFGEYDLSIFSDFPNFTLTVHEVSLTGVDTFEGVELAHIGTMELTIDLYSIMSDKYEIRKVGLDEPNIHVLVLENGMANYDIAKPSTDTVPTPTEEPVDSAAPFHLGLSDYYIRNANVVYDDRAGDMYLDIKGLTHEGHGDFMTDLFTFNTMTEMVGLTYEMEGVKYMNEAAVKLKADLDMDMANMKFTFKENELDINELVLGFDGWLAMPADDIDMDLSLKAQKTEFKNLLSMVPAVYATQFSSIETSGKMSLDAYCKGTYNETNMPGFGAELHVDNAMFHYPDLPESVENINIDATVKREEGPDLDNTIVNVQRFNMSLAQNPVNIKLGVTSPISDPNIDCNIKSQLDLANIGKVYPLEEGEQYNGNVTADVELKGRLSALEEERYEDFVAQGQVILMDMMHRAEGILYTTELKSMYMNFSPQMVELPQLEAKVGNSDFSANGRLDNLLSYVFKDEELAGTFTLNSNYIDLVELMAEAPSTATPAAEGTEASTTSVEGETTVAVEEEYEYGVVPVPANINFNLDANITKLRYPYDEGVILDLENIVGKVKVREEVAYLTDVSVDMLQGNVIMDGYYNTRDINAPLVDLDLKVTDFDFKQSAETFNTFELVAPFLKKAQGTYSTNFGLSTVLGSDFMPVYSTMNGNGNLKSKSVAFEDWEGLNKLGEALKMEDKTQTQEFKNVNMTYGFRDGKVFVEPFNVNLFGEEAEISGTTSFEQDLDYNIAMDVNPNKLGEGFTSLANSALERANAAGANMSLGNSVPVTVKVHNKVTEPKYKVAFPELGGEDLKEELIEEVKEQIEEVKEEAIEEVKETASEQAAKLIAYAEKRAAQIREEAAKQAEKVRKEGYDAADKIEQEAANENIVKRKAAEKLAEKTRKEADDKANKIVEEADARAKKVIDDAKAQAAKLE